MNIGLIKTEDAMEQVEAALAGLLPEAHVEGVDPGVDNIQRAGELSAKAFVDAAEECAQRAEAAGQAALEEGQARKRAADQLAADLRDAGKLFAESMVEFSRKQQAVAESQASMRKLVLNGKG